MRRGATASSRLYHVVGCTREKSCCSWDNNPPRPFLHLSHTYTQAQSAAATVVAACANVRQRLAATVAAAWKKKPQQWLPTPLLGLLKSNRKKEKETRAIGPVCTARISIPPIEPNLAERARISAINLDDYQLDPLTPPPLPSSPFSMAAYQRMIAEMDPT
ncbi:hypothetical protein Tco_0336457 [Tanacetum coccineum]